MKIFKFVPNAITSLNLLAGVLGVIAVFEGRFDQAFYLMLAAAAFDFLDGFAARLLGAYSDLGKELDSLSDMVSFGVLPSLMLCEFMRQSTFTDSVWCFVPLLIAVFSGLRLARFNAAGDTSGGFIGLPTPACAMLCGSLCYYVAANPTSFLAVWAGEQLFFPVLSAVLSILLVCRLPMFSLKLHRDDSRALRTLRATFVVCVLICAAFAIYIHLDWSLAVLLSLLVYILLNLVVAAFKGPAK